MHDSKEVVRKGYDQLSNSYREHFSLSHEHQYKSWVQEFLSLIPQDKLLLELGCGDGIPVAQLISSNYKYFGVDISPVQINSAKQNAPNGTFEIADMAQLNYHPGSFGGIIALYSLIHIPLEEQATLIKNIYQWLQPDGYFFCTVGEKKWTGTERDWIQKGVIMYWSHADAATYTNWFLAAGFTVVRKDFVPEGEGGHALFLLKKNNA